MKKILINIALFILIMPCTFCCMNHGSINYSAQNTIERIKVVADQYAVEKGYDLSIYNPPEIKYNPEKKVWHVSYMQKCHGFIFFKKCPLGGEYDIIIDDLTGNIVYFFQGA